VVAERSMVESPTKETDHGPSPTDDSRRQYRNRAPSVQVASRKAQRVDRPLRTELGRASGSGGNARPGSVPRQGRRRPLRVAAGLPRHALAGRGVAVVLRRAPLRSLDFRPSTRRTTSPRCRCARESTLSCGSRRSRRPATTTGISPSSRNPDPGPKPCNPSSRGASSLPRKCSGSSPRRARSYATRGRRTGRRNLHGRSEEQDHCRASYCEVDSVPRSQACLTF